MSREVPRLAALRGAAVPPPAPPPVPESVDPESLRYHPCEGGCDTLLACSPYAGPIKPPFRCARCTAGKPAWEKDPPYIAPDPAPEEEEEVEEPDYVRDENGIPLEGQVVPLNLAAYLAADRPLDKHTVMTMLVALAVRTERGGSSRFSCMSRRSTAAMSGWGRSRPSGWRSGRWRTGLRIASMATMT